MTWRWRTPRSARGCGTAPWRGQRLILLDGLEEAVSMYARGNDRVDAPGRPQALAVNRDCEERVQGALLNKELSALLMIEQIATYSVRRRRRTSVSSSTFCAQLSIVHMSSTRS